MKKIILDICGGTGAWSKPYRDAAYEVILLTLPDNDIMDMTKGDMPRVAELIKQNKIYGILAAPPCTEFSIARNDKTAKRPRDLRGGVKVINQVFYIIQECLYQSYRIKDNRLKFWAIENPYSGYLKRFIGEPNLIFDPCDYGDPYTKKTGIWGMFNEPIKSRVKPSRGTMVKYASNFNDIKPVDEEYRKKLGVDSRKIRRSITPDGFARAFFEANK